MFLSLQDSYERFWRFQLTIKDFASLNAVSICFNTSGSYRDQQFPGSNLWIDPKNSIEQQNLLVHPLYTAQISGLGALAVVVLWVSWWPSVRVLRQEGIYRKYSFMRHSLANCSTAFCPDYLLKENQTNQSYQSLITPCWACSFTRWCRITS